MRKSRRRPSGTAITSCARDITSANKAPGGFGLGNDEVLYNVDANECLNNGWYAPGKNTPVEGIWIVRADAAYEYVRQTAYAICNSNAVPDYVVCRRNFSKNKWYPWEWVNPPMTLGAEYRTTERFQGKPVYVKTINMGNLPGNSVKQVNFQNRNVVDKIVSVTGQCTSDSGVGISMPYHTGSGPNLETVIYIGAATIGTAQIVTFLKDFSGYKDACITVKYTKLAD